MKNAGAGIWNEKRFLRQNNGSLLHAIIDFMSRAIWYRLFRTLWATCLVSTSKTCQRGRTQRLTHRKRVNASHTASSSYQGPSISPHNLTLRTLFYTSNYRICHTVHMCIIGICGHSNRSSLRYPFGSQTRR